MVFVVSFLITHNEPRIGDSGGLESRNFQSFTNLSNSILLLFKFMKKGIENHGHFRKINISS